MNVLLDIIADISDAPCYLYQIYLSLDTWDTMTLLERVLDVFAKMNISINPGSSTPVYQVYISITCMRKGVYATL